MNETVVSWSCYDPPVQGKREKFLAQVEHFARFVGLSRSDIELDTGFRNYKLGCKAGPEWSVQNLAHEVAHVAQLSEKEVERVNAFGFNFRVPQVEIMGRVYDEPCMWTRPFAALREAEVFALEIVLLKAAFPAMDIKTMIAERAKIHAYMPLPARRESEIDRRSSILGAYIRSYDVALVKWMSRRVYRHLEGLTAEIALKKFHKNWGAILAKQRGDRSELAES